METTETVLINKKSIVMLEEQKENIEKWFYDFPNSPNEPEMRHLYGLILADIEEYQKNAGIYEEPY